MRRWLSRAWACWVVGAACVGPPAPDAALCRDVVDRLCAAPRCAPVDAQLAVDDSCVATLLSRTHCDADDFVFDVPNRRRWLDCRSVLVRSSVTAQHPDCSDVAQFFSTCTDATSFLGATQ